MRVDLVCGFLGAGKTHFIARYCDWLMRKGEKFAVVENEFGAAGVDSALLSARFGGVRELTGGCICCTMKVGFFSLLARLADDRNACARAIVEPSGIFNMDDFFEVIDALQREGLCEPGMCLALADPRALARMDDAEKHMLRGSLTGAGGVLWTQADLCDLEIWNAREALLGGCAGPLDPPLCCYPVPSHLLRDEDFERLQQITAVRRRHARETIDHSTLYQSTSLRPRGEYCPEALAALLTELIESCACGEILRVKGFVRARGGSLAVNCTPGGRSVQPCEAQEPMLNVIGRNLNRTALRERLDAASRDEGIRP